MLRLLAAVPGKALGRRTMTMLAPSAMRREQIQVMKDMNDYFPTVVAQLKEVADRCNIADETVWLEKLLCHTVPGGKMVRALGSYNAVMTLLGDAPGVKEKAMSIAWTQEMMQASMLIADDISDETVLRRGKDAWHVIAGKDAVFDAILVENCAYAVLGMHCDGEALIHAQRLFSEIIFQICMGQNRDNHCTDKKDGRALLDEFTMERYIATCEHKSGGYTFYCPVGTALYACCVFDKAAHDAARDMSSDLGLLYQAQDDYLDIYGIIKKMGKQRTDIRNGKGSWVITEALVQANEEQRQRLKENYGFNDQRKVDNVMKVYEELNMKEVFLKYEKNMIKMIEGKIHKYADVIRPEIFTYSLESMKYHINR